MKLLLSIIFMEILSGAEVDLFVPSFPDLQDTFHLSTFRVELLLGVNMVAYCITSLIVGNLGDKYGRKSIIIMGLVIFNIGSLLCVFANNYWMLLIGRFVQGTGISAVSVLGYVVLADIYSVQQQQKMLGVLNGAVTLSMAFAPVIGSYINLFFQWQGNFVLLLMLGIISLALGMLFIPQDRMNSDVQISLREYLPIFKSKRAIYYSLTIIFFVQGYWIFIGISPILYMQDLGVSLQNFGLYQGGMAIVFSIMSFSSGYFFKKFGEKRCFMLSIWSLILFLFAALVLITNNVSSPLLITLVTQLLAVGVIYPINILWPLLLEAIPNGKARMTAVVTSGRLIVTAINLQLVSLCYNGTFAPLGITMCIMTVVGLISCYKLFCMEKIFV